MGCRLGTAAGFLSGIGLAVAMGLYCPPSAWAQDAQVVARAAPSSASSARVAHSKLASLSAKTGNADADAPAKKYFVEFRARNAASYGHFYVMYGEVNARQEIVKSHIAGFFPAGDARDCENCSVFNWTIGHVIFVPSEIGVSDGDLEEKYVTARFRVWLTAAQYNKLVAYIEEKKANKPLWNALWKNCVTFGRDVAAYMGLKLPLLLAIAPSVMIYPKDFVDDLREANGVPNEQPPLKDAAGSLAAPSDSASIAPARPRKPKLQPAVNAKPAAMKTSHARPDLRPVAGLSHEETGSDTIH